MTILSKVVTRPNPQMQLGPVDLSCAFLVVDARSLDFPIVYASNSFEKLTGYDNDEILGKNCRFLQAPDGQVTSTSRRRFTDNNTVFHIKGNVLQGKETQVSIINYKKDGKPFLNLVTIVPVFFGQDHCLFCWFSMRIFSFLLILFIFIFLGHGRSTKRNPQYNEK